jgi:hypothetical protein
VPRHLFLGLRLSEKLRLLEKMQLRFRGIREKARLVRIDLGDGSGGGGALIMVLCHIGHASAKSPAGTATSNGYGLDLRHMLWSRTRLKQASERSRHGRQRASDGREDLIILPAAAE